MMTDTQLRNAFAHLDGNGDPEIIVSINQFASSSTLYNHAANRLMKRSSEVETSVGSVALFATVRGLSNKAYNFLSLIRTPQASRSFQLVRRNISCHLQNRRGEHPA